MRIQRLGYMREAQNTINMKHPFYRLVCSKEKDKIELFY